MPFYDGVEIVQIGVDSSAVIRGPQNNRLTKRANRKPIVFYGTSITQGGCASRPGNVEYIRGESLLGSDGEGTVDGVHLTDLGFFRFSKALRGYLNILPLLTNVR